LVSTLAFALLGLAVVVLTVGLHEVSAHLAPRGRGAAGVQPTYEQKWDIDPLELWKSSQIGFPGARVLVAPLAHFVSVAETTSALHPLL
jgi:hypothetical protein